MKVKKGYFSALCLILVAACAQAGSELPTTQATQPVQVSQAPQTVATATGAATPTAPATPSAMGSPTAGETATTSVFQPYALPALSYLAVALGIPVEQIGLKSTEPVQWKDACLEAGQSGEACAQVVTPGYRLVFTTTAGDIEAHSDQSGLFYRLPFALKPAPASLPLIAWQTTGGIAGVCQQLHLFNDGQYMYWDCKNPHLLSQGKLSTRQFPPFSGAATRFSTFKYETVTPKGSADVPVDLYTLYGNGSLSPSDQDKQNLDVSVRDLISSLANGHTPTASSPNPASGSGIEGQILLSPTCPGPARIGATGCAPKPYQGTVEVKDAAGNIVSQFACDAQGHFKVDLQPGSYALHLLNQGALLSGKDQVVKVEPGRYIQETLTFDTGMR